MSELMRDAVISMPLELAMGDEWSRFQFHDRAQGLLKEVHQLEAERDRLREALTNIIASWDARVGEKEVFRTHEHLPDGYWSPSASMVDSSAIAAARQALGAQS